MDVAKSDIARAEGAIAVYERDIDSCQQRVAALEELDAQWSKVHQARQVRLGGDVCVHLRVITCGKLASHGNYRP